MNPALRGPHGPANGELLGPWRILEPIDSGTYGSVYRASLADRPEADGYALKLAHHAEDERMEREAELLLRIRHPHVGRSWGAAAMAAGLAIAIILALPDPQERGTGEPSLPVAETMQEPAARVPETVGVADAGVDDGVLSTAVGMPPAGIPNTALALPLPKAPDPGQKKPPCDPRSEHLILGACWTRIDVKPPCGSSGYEYDGKCVLPSVPTRRSPTSDPP
jgi:hypothetical protein